MKAKHPMPNKSAMLSKDVRTAIWDHVQRSKVSTPVSVKETIRQLRRLVPGCTTDDRELASLIGALATAAGRNVHFDGGDDLPGEDDTVH
jgi:hypothetical protein